MNSFKLNGAPFLGIMLRIATDQLLMLQFGLLAGRENANHLPQTSVILNSMSEYTFDIWAAVLPLAPRKTMERAEEILKGE